MSKKLRLQRGEIATIITIVSLVILGASTLVSSVFLSKNKQTTSTKAVDTPTRCCIKRSTCSNGKKGTEYVYINICNPDTCTSCSQFGVNYFSCSSVTENQCALSQPTTVATAVPTSAQNNSPTQTPIPIRCVDISRKDLCDYHGNRCEWKYLPLIGSLCQNKTQPTAMVNTPTPTRAPGNELPGYEGCNRCCIQDLQCGIPADGNGYKCGKSQTRIRWYSYNCSSSCSSFGSGSLTKYIDCPSDVGRENRLKCVDGGCTNYYGGLPVPTATVGVQPTTVIPTSSKPPTGWCIEPGKRDWYGGECWYCYYKGATPVSSSGCSPTVSPTSGGQAPIPTLTTAVTSKLPACNTCDRLGWCVSSYDWDHCDSLKDECKNIGKKCGVLPSATPTKTQFPGITIPPEMYPSIAAAYTNNSELFKILIEVNTTCLSMVTSDMGQAATLCGNVGLQKIIGFFNVAENSYNFYCCKNK